MKWQVGDTLPVELDFGTDLNAFYDREGLKFFHGSAAGRTVYSGESPDVVCHELGHAVLDSLKPQLWDAASIEVAAFHESFGDISALLSALQLPSLRQAVLAETSGVLYRTSRLSRLAEQLGWAIRQSAPSAVEADCLRNAVNTFSIAIPTCCLRRRQLPPSAPSRIRSPRVHRCASLGTGGMLATKARKTRPRCTGDQDIGAILVPGSASVRGSTFFSQAAATMLNVAATQYSARLRRTARSAFVVRSSAALGGDGYDACGLARCGAAGLVQRSPPPCRHAAFRDQYDLGVFPYLRPCRR
jgi:hypothetical protein